MKKIIFLLSCLVLMVSAASATPVGVSFDEPLQNQRVDRGLVFNASIEKADLGPAASYNYVIDPLVDIVVEIETGSEGAVSVVLYEDPTTTGGTTGTAYNENRTSAKLATTIATLTSDPTTVSVTGTAIYTKIAQDGDVGKRFVLDAGSDYMLAITNVSASTDNVTAGLKFYKNALRIK